MLGVLPADRVQRPHRHQSVALDLIMSCAPGCYSLVGPERRRAPATSSTRSGCDWEARGRLRDPARAVAQPPQRVRARPPTSCPSRTPGSTPTCGRSTSGSPRRPAEPGGVRQRPLPPPGHQPGAGRGPRVGAGAGGRAARPGGRHRHPAPRRCARGRGGHRRRRAPPARRWSAAPPSRSSGTGAEVEELPGVSVWAGRVGPLVPVALSATRLADDAWALRRLARRRRLRPVGPAGAGRPVHLPDGASSPTTWPTPTRAPGGRAATRRARPGPGGTRLALGAGRATRVPSASCSVRPPRSSPWCPRDAGRSGGC